MTSTAIRPVAVDRSAVRHSRGAPAQSAAGAVGATCCSALLFLSPWIVGFFVFTAWPLIYSAYLSLTDYDVINDPNFIGFENYAQLFADPKIAARAGQHRLLHRSSRCRST